MSIHEHLKERMSNMLVRKCANVVMVKYAIDEIILYLYQHLNRSSNYNDFFIYKKGRHT